MQTSSTLCAGLRTAGRQARNLGGALGLLALLGCSESELSIQNTDPFAQPDSLIEIYAPVNGSRVPANMPIILDYAVLRGPDGAYVQIRVDKLRPATVHALKGQHHIDPLTPGPHRIAVNIYNAAGKPSGSAAEINLLAE